ncbi:RfaG Glycosyltransferase [Rhabdaerophilaceae bacterium]
MRLGTIITALMFRLRLFHLWRLLPRGLRQRLVRRILPVPVRVDRLPRPVLPIVIIGPFRSSASFGRLSRVLFANFERAGLPVYAHDISEGFLANDLAMPLAPVPDGIFSAPATLIIVGTPDQFAYIRSFLPSSLEQKFVIGLCPWELESLPEAWLEPLATLDAVYVPSQFVANAFTADFPALPQRIVPCLEVPRVAAKPDRARWAIRDDAFVVLTVFSLRSGLERKNPAGAIAAFKRAFPDSKKVQLVVKTTDAELEAGAYASLCALIDDDPRILLVTETLSETDLETLIASTDVLLSLHRAEGFGLVPAQAMLHAKPVIMTGWSSVTEFATSESSVLIRYELVAVSDPEERFSGAMRWAEPDIDDATAALRRLFADPAERTAMGRRGQRQMTAFIADREARFQAFLAEAFSQPLEPRPRIAQDATENGAQD